MEIYFSEICQVLPRLANSFPVLKPPFLLLGEIISIWLKSRWFGKIIDLSVSFGPKFKMSQQRDTDVEKNESYVALTKVSSPDVLTILYSRNSKRTLIKC